MPLDLSDEVMNAATEVVVKEVDKGLKVGDKELTSKEVAAALRHLQGGGQALLVRTPMARCYVALERSWGDPVTAARALVALNTQALPQLGVRPMKDTDLTRMPRREGAAQAAFAAADTLEQFPPVMENLGESITTLRRTGMAAHTFDILRDGYRVLDRQVGANELAVLPVLRAEVGNALTELQTKMASHPLIQQGLEPAVVYLEGAAQQGVDSRRRAQSQREETERTLRQKVEAEAREEGRREAMSAMSDKLATAFATKR